MIEHRKHSNESEDPRLLRISVGIEDIEVSCAIAIYNLCSRFNQQDLKADFRQALNAIAKVKAKL